MVVRSASLGGWPARASWVALQLTGACAGAPLPTALSVTPPVSATPAQGDHHLPPSLPNAAAQTSVQTLPPRLPPAPLPGGEQPTPDKSLPELRVEPLGMHVGGGKNSPEEKAPFHRALERQFPAFLECYRLAEHPWAGGSFGVDIKIARSGGLAAAQQPRTRIRGVGFQDCMLDAFSKVEFERPSAGPTVISYSVSFTLGKARR